LRSVSSRRPSRDEVASILRVVTPDKAFHFYMRIGEPLGKSASSLAELGDMLRELDSASVQFHLERGDFESWVRMLGDVRLANQVGSLRGKSAAPDRLRDSVGTAVRQRVAQLRKIAGLK